MGNGAWAIGPKLLRPSSPLPLTDTRPDQLLNSGSQASSQIQRARLVPCSRARGTKQVEPSIRGIIILETLVAKIVTACFGSISAISHRAPATILSSAFVDEQPAASPIILTLADLLSAWPSQQISRRPCNRFQQVGRRRVRKRR